MMHDNIYIDANYIYLFIKNKIIIISVGNIKIYEIINNAMGEIEFQYQTKIKLANKIKFLSGLY